MRLKMLGLGVVVILATGSSVPSDAAGGTGWTCNTTCRDSRGFDYVQVSSGETPDLAYQNLSCRAGDTVSGDINCWEDNLSH